MVSFSILMKKSTLKILKFETYLKLIRNSIGSKMFRNFYVESNKKKKDILENGNLSCARVVSSLLLLSGLIKETHGTVKGTLKDMMLSGWKINRKLKIGSVLLWEELKYADKYAKRGHQHIGFYLGKEKALSNSSQLGYPVIHDLTFGKKNKKPVRKIKAIYWNKALD